MKIIEKPIDKELLLLNQNITTKKQALDLLVERAMKIGLINKSNIFLEAVQRRELEASTAVGYQIALPHGKSEVVNQAFIGFLQTKNEFDWDGDGKEKVRLIFLIGVPEDNQNNVHLKFISQLSRKLLDENFRDGLLNAKKVNEVYQILEVINQNL